MSSSTLSRRDNHCRYDAELGATLEGLQDLNLSDAIYEETPYLSAHGGQCDIFTAKSRKHIGITIAIKRLRIHALENRDASEIILRELRVWTSLKHPNVLPLLGFVMHGKYPAFVSQWMMKGSLRTYMRGNLNISDKFKYLSGEIASGLYHLHCHGIIHSDLKSDNILISDEGRPLLADFGISHIMASTFTATSTTAGVGGSVRWMAHELLSPNTTNIRGFGKHTMQTDVWAYGMVLYELLTGNIPFFELKNDIQVALAIIAGQKPSLPRSLCPDIRRGQIAPNPDVGLAESRLLWTICGQCWEESPVARARMLNICSMLSNVSGRGAKRLREPGLSCDQVPNNELPSLSTSTDEGRILKRPKRSLESKTDHFATKLEEGTSAINTSEQAEGFFSQMSELICMVGGSNVEAMPSEVQDEFAQIFNNKASTFPALVKPIPRKGRTEYLDDALQVPRG